MGDAAAQEPDSQFSTTDEKITIQFHAYINTYVEYEAPSSALIAPLRRKAEKELKSILMREAHNYSTTEDQMIVYRRGASACISLHCILKALP